MEASKKNIRTWSMLGQRGCAFAQALPEIASARRDVVAVTADLSLFSGLERFRTTFPDQFVNVGIAEQNMIGVAAGLAAEGNCVYATTYASFITMRGFEQIRDNLGVMRCNVKAVGSTAGAAMASFGVSHHAIEDIGLMRLIPGMRVIAPADGMETIKAMQAVSEDDEPAYIRLTGNTNCPPVYMEDYPFEIGKGVTLREGNRVAILAHGMIVSDALSVADQLAAEGRAVTVANIHTIKPLDERLILQLAKEHETFITIEEHSIVGGLGGAVAELLAESDKKTRLIRLGFRDCYTARGTREYILQQAGLDKENMLMEIRKALS